MDLNLFLLYLLSTLCILVKTVICHSCGTRNDFFKKAPCEAYKNSVNKRPCIKKPHWSCNIHVFLRLLHLVFSVEEILMKFWTFQVATPGVKQGPVSQAAPQQPVIADKQAGHEPASPRSLQRSRYFEILLCAFFWFCFGSDVCSVCCKLWVLPGPIYWTYDLALLLLRGWSSISLLQS